MANIDELREKLRVAMPKFESTSILEPGEYQFTILEAAIERHKKGYEYVFLKLQCQGTAADGSTIRVVSMDQFPLTDALAPKFKSLLLELGLDIETFTLEKLVGRSGALTAVASRDGKKVYYNYRR
jgi:hypothetical protein